MENKYQNLTIEEVKAELEAQEESYSYYCRDSNDLDYSVIDDYEDRIAQLKLRIEIDGEGK